MHDFEKPSKINHVNSDVTEYFQKPGGILHLKKTWQNMLKNSGGNLHLKKINHAKSDMGFGKKKSWKDRKMLTQICDRTTEI